MANPYAQKTRQRKFIYAAVILVLFTGSLMHRKFVVEKQAEQLKLRETAKGEVELTSSAVRLTLTGSRGLAVTFLWSAALKQQEKHEWNELELLVGAITKLQPYFITPWLFQGWNLAYNVAGECDQPRDKYYYVSRGLNLLAEGERRNMEQGIGQPDLRHFIGIAYQGKIGISDEKNAMRCLLDLSCMDPVRRDPARFWTVADGRNTINLAELAKLTRDQPRFVRRLRDALGYTQPKQIVDFITQNREVPTRYEKPAGGFEEQKETPLKKDYREQFPILPPPDAGLTPNPGTADFDVSGETMDVFLVCRAWYSYAQQSLPEPNPDPSLEAEETPGFDRRKHRLPKSPALPIFRGYPARAQEYVAETLTEEGWFDEDGWLVRDWFDSQGLADDSELHGGEFRAGAEPKYHSGPAWERAYQQFLKLGTSTGLYLYPSELAALEREAQLFRKTYRVKSEPIANQRPEHRKTDSAMYKSWKAHQKLFWRVATAVMTNYEGHLRTAEAERTPEAVMARKLFYRAERLRRFENDPEQALALYEQGWPLWLAVLTRYPGYTVQSTNQEDLYEMQLKHLRLAQNQRASQLKALALGMAQLTVWPPAPLEDLLSAGDKSRILPIRSVEGLLDWARIYEAPEREKIAHTLLTLTQLGGVPRPILMPGQEDWVLISLSHRAVPLSPGWRHLISDDNIRQVKVRLGLIKLAPAIDDTPIAP
jgi:hypothetical protein